MDKSDAIEMSPSGSRSARLNGIIIAAGCMGILAIAAYLPPDARGFGTHEQLGLPPCISAHYLGVPCPLCGMTTAFALMAHARPVDAFRAQPAGATFFVLCILILLGALATAISGRAPERIATLARSRWVATTIVVLLVGAWMYKLIVYWR